MYAGERKAQQVYMTWRAGFVWGLLLRVKFRYLDPGVQYKYMKCAFGKSRW